MVLFLVLSGLAGPRIISAGILFRDGFAIYGGAGKALIFGIVAFALISRRAHSALGEIKPWHPALLGWLGLGAVFFVLSWFSVGQLIDNQRTIWTLLGAHVGLLLSVVCALLASFGPANLWQIWRERQHELILATAIAAGFYGFLLAVYALWQPLASAVLAFVSWLLRLSGLSVTQMPPHALILDKFGITVEKSCSGIESVALFSSLYAVVGLLDWRRLNKRRFFIVFPFALFALLFLNALRVYGLIMAGYYINPQIAFTLFHTYAGLVFFMIYSAVFWLVAYNHLLKKTE